MISLQLSPVNHKFNLAKNSSRNGDETYGRNKRPALGGGPFFRENFQTSLRYFDFDGLWLRLLRLRQMEVEHPIFELGLYFLLTLTADAADHFHRLDGS